MNVFKNTKKKLDSLLLVTTLTMLSLMTIVIIVQVFSRQFFNYTPSWSEELSRVLFVWVAFLGIAYGFKHKLHIGVGFFANLFPEKIQTACDLLAKILVIGFGVLMIYYGMYFSILMADSTLPGLRLPSTVLYAVIPVTGLYVLLYGIELLFVKGMHEEYLEEEEG